MHEHGLSDDHHDAFGWLKTTALVVVVFAAMISTTILAAKAETCADRCRASENACRLQTKGAPQCLAQFNACMQSCMATLAKPDVKSDKK